MTEATHTSRSLPPGPSQLKLPQVLPTCRRLPYGAASTTRLAAVCRVRGRRPRALPLLRPAEPGIPRSSTVERSKLWSSGGSDKRSSATPKPPVPGQPSTCPCPAGSRSPRSNRNAGSWNWRRAAHRCHRAPRMRASCHVIAGFGAERNRPPARVVSARVGRHGGEDRRQGLAACQKGLTKSGSNNERHEHLADPGFTNLMEAAGTERTPSLRFQLVVAGEIPLAIDSP